LAVFRLIEPWAGALLLGLTLLDVFLTVLYARAGHSIFSGWVARGVWRLFRLIARGAGRHGGTVLSYCGPAILVGIVLAWSSLLTASIALILHPALGHGLRAETGPTPTDFLTALYAAGSSISVVGARGIGPVTDPLRLFYLFTSLTGLSVLTLALTYLMQVYSALQLRNSLASEVHLMSGGTGEAAELIGRLGPGGRYEACYSSLADLAADLTRAGETLHLYPVLFYFRFPEPHYALSRVVFVLLDAAALIRSALEEERAGWLQASAAVAQIDGAGSALAEQVRRNFLGGTGAPEARPPADGWRDAYDRAAEVLRRFDAPVRSDADAAAGRYAELRARWDGLVSALIDAANTAGDDARPAEPGSPDKGGGKAR
jgi:hypothetical protein